MGFYARPPEDAFPERSARLAWLLVPLTLLFLALVLVLYVLNHPAKIDGASMAPGLLHDDRVLVSRGYGVPKVGDIVEFEIDLPSGPERLIKRIVAVGGDTVTVVGDVVTVAGRPPLAASLRTSTAVWPDLSIDIRHGDVFVAGDNRPDSLDSRFFGPISRESITGRVIIVILPISRFQLVDASDGSG